jgi:PEP-CTERM motif
MRISIVALAASVISTAAASASDLRYTYTGDDFTNVDVHGPSTPFTTSDFISFTFTSPYAVGPNLSDAGFAGPITSWSLTLGPLSYSSLDPTSVLYSINFSTDSSGQITAWQFTTQTNVVAPNLQPAQYPPTPYEEEVASFNLPPTFGVADLIYIPSIYQDSYYAYNSDLPGTWTVTSVPEPPIWAMMLAGFATLGFAHHARRRRGLPQPAQGERLPDRPGGQSTGNDRKLALGLPHIVARLARRMTAVGAMFALAFSLGLAATGAAFALPDATFTLSLEALGQNGDYSSPGDETDSYCRSLGSCGTASGSLTSNLLGMQSVSGSAMTFEDLGAQSYATVDFYFMIKGPANEPVTYGMKASGATSVFGGGQATALLYLDGTLLNWACSSSMTGYCAVNDQFAFDTEFSAPSNTVQKLEIDLTGGTAAFGGGPYSASIDPMITVDPAYAAEGYSLVLSPNVTLGSVAPSVPEPATWVMMLSGFAALGFAYRIRRRARGTSGGIRLAMPKSPFCIACGVAIAPLFSAPAARAEVLLVTYTSSYVGTEIFKFDTLDGSGVPGYGDSEISFPLLYDSQGNNNVTFAAPHVENPSYPGTTIVTCCDTGFYDGINPPIFTGGMTALDWPLGMYVGAYGTFTVALAPAAPEASTWAMMLVGFGGLGFAALRRRARALRNSDSAQPQTAR